MINEKRISKSGSITIPSHMRRDVGMAAGDRYEIVDQGDGNFLLTRTLGSCFFCKSKEELMKVDAVLICRDCAKKIVEKVEGKDE